MLDRLTIKSRSGCGIQDHLDANGTIRANGFTDCLQHGAPNLKLARGKPDVIAQAKPGRTHGDADQVTISGSCVSAMWGRHTFKQSGGARLSLAGTAKEQSFAHGEEGISAAAKVRHSGGR
jgi:hypothetical protein